MAERSTFAGQQYYKIYWTTTKWWENLQDEKRRNLLNFGQLYGPADIKLTCMFPCLVYFTDFLVQFSLRSPAISILRGL